MIIEINGGKDGIAEYLRNGQKKDREFTRDELDKRLVLQGDLELTNNIINSLDYKENYHHISLSFKEDYVSEKDLKKASDEFEKFIKAAYKDEEINFYSEAHIPKIKSYKSKSGELVIRKPHIHIVIPNQNLLSGKNLKPLGYVKNNTHYIDSFQELFNQEYGYESPKDNLRNEFNLESTIISRQKADLFTRNISEKEEILSQIMDKRIDSYEKFQDYLKTQGAVKTRNKGKDNEYLNLKLPHHNQGINLKEHCFSKEFIEEYDHHDKLDFLLKKAEEKYIEKKDTYKSKKTENYQELLKDWYEFRALENKYVNANTKFYKQTYKNFEKEEKIKYLNEKHKEFYQKYDLEADIQEFIKDVKIETKEITEKDISKLDKEYRDNYTKKLEKNKVLGTENLRTLGDIENGKNRVKEVAQKITRVQKSYSRANRSFIATTKRDGLQKLSTSQLVHHRYSLNQLLQSNVSSDLENKRSRRSVSILRRQRDSIVRTRKRRVADNFISSKLNSFYEKKEIEELNIKDDLTLNIYSKLKDKGVLENKYIKNENGIFLNSDSKRQISLKQFLGEELNMVAAEIQLLDESIKKIEMDYNKNLRKGEKMPIQVNIKTNEKDKQKVDYLQVGENNRVGKFTGFIYDQADNQGSSSATLFMIDDKVVDYDEFKKLPNFKELDNKMKELVNSEKEQKYSKELRMNYVKENLTLTDRGQVFANSRFNLKELQPIEVGISKFDNSRKVEQNIFTRAKQFVLENYHKAKDKIQFALTSKSDLAASNVALALELKELQAKMEEIKDYQQALEAKAEKIKEAEQNNSKEKSQEQNENKNYSFKDILKEAKELGDKIEDAKDISELAEQNPDFADKRDTALELLSNLSEKSELINLSDNQIDSLKLGEAKALNLAARNEIPINSKDKLKEFMQVIKNVANMSLEQNLDFNSVLEKTLEKVSDKFQTQEQKQQKSKDQGQEI